MHLVIGAVAAFLLKNPNFRQAVGIWRLRQAVQAWESQRNQQIVVRHRMPGRLRLGVGALVGDQQLAAQLEDELNQLDGVRQAQACAPTSSLLIEYDSTKIDEATLTSQLFDIIALRGHSSNIGVSADPSLFQVTVIHSLPGRARLQVPIINYLDTYQPFVVQFFEGQDGIEEVRLNPFTATALVYFDEERISLEGVLNLLATSLDMVRDMLCPIIPQAAQGNPSPVARTNRTTVMSSPGVVATGPRFARSPRWNPYPGPPTRPRTVQERSMHEESSQEKLVDVLVSAITLGLTLLRRRGGWAAPAFGPRRFLTAPALTSLTVGIPIFRNGLSALMQGTVNADTLSTVAIFASLLSGKDLSALIIILLADIGEMVTAYSAERTREAIATMLSVGEPYVWQVQSDGSEVKVPLERVQAGDAIAVRTGEKISVDGVVIDGAASVDQASITGEFMPMQKDNGQEVFAGTIVKRGRLVVRAEKVGDATAVARIIHMVEEASQRKAPIQNFADRFSQQLVPISFLMAGLVYLITRNLNRALNMLIIDYSCGVRLSTATAFSGSVFNAARQGILVKGSSYLEMLNDIDTLILDKTGTVTEGKPLVVEVQPARSDGVAAEKEVLVWAAAAEQHTTHPLADAVMSYVNAQGWQVPRLESEEIVVAHGVEAKSDGRAILVGSRRFLDEKGVSLDATMLSLVERMIHDGQNVLYVALDGDLIGLIGVKDPLREDVKKALNRLRRLAIDDVILLTGDIEFSAEKIANRLAVDQFQANVLPEDKADMVRRLQAKGVQVAMVGDGVNDAPALAHADIGIAMGARGTDIAIETADVTIAGDDPLKIPALIQISQQTMNIVRQNFAVAVGVNTLGIVLGALGYITPMAAAVLHNMTTVGVVINSTRLLFYKPK
jgi:cation-transporting P-type ATPase C